jgi:signal peptidase I
LNRLFVRVLLETGALVGVLLVALLFVRNYHVSGVSMQPGLTDGQNVLVFKFTYLFHNPERGDVIVFHNPQNSNEDLIKRVIGLPGDTIKTDSTHLWINNVQLDEKAYINAPPNTPLNPGAQTWHVPPDQYFVLGDNRPASYDSRYIGPIPKDYIVGTANFVLSNLHSIDTHNDAFAKIKNP